MKKLVAYFSVSGNTKKRAEQLAEVVHADLHEIAPAVLYTQADLNYRDKTSRSTIEMTDENSHPDLKEPHTDLTDYDTIYIGYPIWWGLAPREINTFIENNDLKDKKIIYWATSGGSPIDHSIKDLKRRYPELNVAAEKMLNKDVTEDIA